MFWGKDFKPRDYLTPPTPFTVGQMKPETVPVEVAAAIEALEVAAEQFGGQTFIRDGDGDSVTQARAALDAVILKHLRGEA